MSSRSAINRESAVPLSAIRASPLCRSSFEAPYLRARILLQSRITESGVRNSCDSVARNSSLARVAFSASVRAARSLSSSTSRSRSSEMRSVTSWLVPTKDSNWPLGPMRGTPMDSTQRHAPSARRTRALALNGCRDCSASRNAPTYPLASSGCTSACQSPRRTSSWVTPKNSSQTSVHELDATRRVMHPDHQRRAVRHDFESLLTFVHERGLVLGSRTGAKCRIGQHDHRPVRHQEGDERNQERGIQLHRADR